MKTADFRHVIVAVVAFSTGHFLPASVAGAAPPTGDELQGQIQQLQAQVMRLEQASRAPSRSPVPGTATNATEVQIAQLTENVGRILQVLQITSQGVTIESKGNLLLRADKDVQVSSGRNAEIKAGSTLNMGAGGRADLRGALVSINNGGRPVATQGGTTVGNANTQTITVGSPTVFVP